MCAKTKNKWFGAKREDSGDLGDSTQGNEKVTAKQIPILPVQDVLPVKEIYRGMIVRECN